MDIHKLKIWGAFLFICVAVISGCVTKSTNNSANSTSLPSTPNENSSIINDARKVAFISNKNNKVALYTINLDGSNITNITEKIPDLLNITTPAWSPSGEYIAFSGLQKNGTYQIFVVKPDSFLWKQLTEDSSAATMPAWSPDGQYIVYLTERDGVLSVNRNIPTGEIYLTQVDGSEQRRITNNQDFERSFQWSPIENFLVVSSNVYTSSGYDIEQIYLMDMEGVIQKQLTEVGYNSYPKWSPDGNLILFNSTRIACSGVCIMNSDGSNQICLIKDIPPSDGRDAISNITPSWTPDGKHIIFSSNRSGDYNIYMVQVDGSGLLQITNEPGDELFPIFSPVP